MLKLIDKIEKSKTFWFLLIIFVIFFLLRLPSVIEPDWYGDEGIYQVLGRAIFSGHLLYTQAWDNKPPLLYIIYALFNGDLYSVRFLSLIVGLLTTGLFFALSQTLFKNLKTSIITTSVFTALFATPLIEGNIANAENFMLLPITLAALIIYKTITKENHKSFAIRYWLFGAGLLLGIALLFKIVAVFDFATFFVFLIISKIPEKFSFTSIKKLFARESRIKNHASWFITLLSDSCFMILGFLIPLVITIIYFTVNKALPAFIQATFFGNIGYVGYGNALLIPQGFLILKLLILAGIVYLLLVKRTKLAHPTIFILLWMSFALFNAFFSQRPYTHYLLVLIPSLCLLLGLVVNVKQQTEQRKFLALFLLVIAIIFTTFRTYSIKKTFLYYQNAFLFMTNQKSVPAYQTFFDEKTPRDYALASYIKMNSKPNEPLFLWGNNAQIYALSNTMPISKYTVAYHITQNKNNIQATQQAINKVQPKFVIILPNTPNFPFRIDGYVTKFALDGAIIYEKSF